MKYLCLLGVYMSGFNTALNLMAIRYPESMPTHLKGEWWEVVLAAALAVLFGAAAVSKKT